MQLSAERSDRLLRLLDFCLEINSERNLETLIELLVNRIPRVLGAERGTLLLHDPERAELWSRLAGGLDKGMVIRLPDDSGLAGACFHGNASVNVADAYADPRFNQEVDRETGFTTRSILSLPLRDAGGVPIGVVQVMNRPGGFGPDEEAFCSLLAAQVGIAVASAHAFERLRREQDALQRENRRLRDELHQRGPGPGLIGNSPAFTRLLDRVRQVAPTSTTVLITGETGTGKELIARRIHELSARSAKAFIALNCSAVPGALIESELFGYERGAFTGAVDRKAGLFEAADGGTLFLDEIGELPLELQAKLLRVLQEGEVRRLGSTTDQAVDVRIVAATNRSLRAMVREGTFREDLYYRLNVVPTELPPLRERRQDIPLLAAAFLSRMAQRHGKPEPRLAAETLECLSRHDFPGNIRELENAMERAVVLANGPVITLGDLPAEIRGEEEAGSAAAAPRTNDELKEAKRLARDQAQATVERSFIESLLGSTGGNVTKAAAAAGMNRSLLQQMMARHGLNAEDFRS
jgi:Nif-specific regulatory protein